MKSGADGQPVTWYRCPLAVIAEEPNLPEWANWAARHVAAAQAGGLSPFEQEARYSAVGWQVFHAYSRGQADAIREASQDTDGNHRQSAR